MKIRFYFLGLLSAALLLTSCRQSQGDQQQNETSMTAENTDFRFLYIGTYTMPMGHVQGKGEGVYVYDMNTKAAPRNVAPDGINPSFLTLSPDRRFLFTVNEVGQDVAPEGWVSAYRVDQQMGQLIPVGSMPQDGLAPCHLTTDNTGRLLFVANYSSGTVVTLPIREDGKILSGSDVRRLEGSGPHPDQQSSHPHMVCVSPDNQWAYVPDKGSDRVYVFLIDLQNQRLVPTSVGHIPVEAGAGPRHMAFHPNGRYVYLINELDNTIYAFAYDPQTGNLTELQRVTTLPEGFSGESFCADIHLTPDGRFLYGSNRGHDSIVAFAVDPDSGKLTYIEHEPTQGSFPRNFMIDPQGAKLYVANQNSDNVVIFQITNSGALEPTGEVIRVPTPVCLLAY